MNKLHQDILDEFEKNSGKPSKRFDSEKYLGSSHVNYHFSVPATRAMAKKWVKENREISFWEFKRLLDSLFSGNSVEEKCFGPKLLEYSPNLRKLIAPADVDRWLNYLEGWAEVDSLCQNLFTAQDLDRFWKDWEKYLFKWAKDKNVHKRRASLVLLTGPVSSSTDHKFSKVAFRNIDALINEREILITKAISWLLRSLIKNHKDGVAQYLSANKNSLPKIAVRETETKLTTGKKNQKKLS